MDKCAICGKAKPLKVVQIALIINGKTYKIFFQRYLCDDCTEMLLDNLRETVGNTVGYVKHEVNSCTHD